MALLCPHCQFENSDDQKFCAKCGTSLVEQPCFNCQTLVSFTQETCPNCGAITGKLGWAVLLPPQPGRDLPVLTPDDYLDESQRYRLLTELTNCYPQVWVCQVLDCHPLHIVPSEIDSEPIDTDTRIEGKEAEIDTDEQDLSPHTSLYLTLGERFPDLIPAVQDAWIDHNQTEYVVLEDRSTWQSLNNVSELPSLQILAYLQQMTVLWEEFSEKQISQSLLEVENLLLDEDECLGLKQIYPNSAAVQPSLADLGRIWQHLFPYAGEALQSLFTSLLTEEIDTPETLLTQLRHIEMDMDIDVGKSGFSLPSVIPDLSEDIDLDIQIDGTGSDWDGGDDPTEGDNLPTLVLPMQLLKLVEAAVTDIGRQREHNEDYYGIFSQIENQEDSLQTKYKAKGLYIVCDGMGGHAAGEVASKMAVETLKNYFAEHWQEEFPSEEAIRHAILLTNQKIYQENIDNGKAGSERMGTTLVMMLIQDTKAAIAHVGDSRAYYITRKRGINQITLDHAVAQQEILCGVEPDIAYGRHDAYQLTQALGPRDNNFVHPEIQFFDLKEDTVILLCSDGFSDNYFVETEAKHNLISLVNSKAHIEQELKQLLESANQHNGHDNLTAVVVKVKVQPLLKRSF